MGDSIVTPEFLQYLKDQEGFLPGIGYIHSSGWPQRDTAMHRARLQASGAPPLLGIPAGIFNAMLESAVSQKLADGKTYRNYYGTTRQDMADKGYGQLRNHIKNGNGIPLDKRPGLMPFHPIPKPNFSSTAYRHALDKPGPVADAMLSAALNEYGKVTQQQLDKSYGKGTFSKLPQQSQQAITDLVFHGGFISKWPKLTDALVRGDMETARKENVRRTYKGRAKRRENAFETTFLK